MKRHLYISSYEKYDLYPPVAKGQVWVRNAVPVTGVWTQEIVIMSEPEYCENYSEPAVYALAIPENYSDSWQFWAGVSVIHTYYQIKLESQWFLIVKQIYSDAY